MPEERLQKTLARAGFGSRRACETLISEGRVTVGGRVASLGDKADPSSVDEIEVDGHKVRVDPQLRYYVFNKPLGVVTTMDDPQGREDISRFLPEGPRVFPVGRLDRDSEGLLLLTNDGELANRLTHPRYGVEKEYLAEVEGTPDPADLVTLRSGIDLEDGRARALDVRVVGRTSGRTAIEIVMGEGRKREVRRLMDAIGHPVVRLIRLRLGPQTMQGIAPGEVRELGPEEVRQLYLAAGL